VKETAPIDAAAAVGFIPQGRRHPTDRSRPETRRPLSPCPARAGVPMMEG
jgi:hypothetical protein